MSSDELLDVLDEHGEPTGQVLPRREVHTQDLWHRLANVWIVNSKGEVLLQKRSATKERFPNCWDISANGHVVAGMTTVTTAQQETKEELGLDLPITALESIYQEKNPHKTIDDVFLVQRDVNLDELSLQADEVTAVEWRSLDELEDDVTLHPGWYYPHDYVAIIPLIRQRIRL